MDMGTTREAPWRRSERSGTACRRPLGKAQRQLTRSNRRALDPWRDEVAETGVDPVIPSRSRRRASALAHLTAIRPKASRV
jgi:hypothetical protein